MHRDEPGAKMGMWLFLFSELLLFGGLFLVYAVYFSRYRTDFISAGKHLDTLLGTLNTAVLLTSSLLVAMAVSALRSGFTRKAAILLILTVFCAGGFLAVKYVEWGGKISHGLYPNGPELLKLPKGEIMFFNLYYLVTGLHGLHVVIGALLLSCILGGILIGRVGKNEAIWLENSGLYWHLVDLIWVYVFPLFYLVT